MNAETSPTVPLASLRTGSDRRYSYSAQAVQSFQTAKAAGVKIALGSDTVYEPLTTYGEYSALEYRALVG